MTDTVFNAEIPDYFLNSVQWWSPREKDISFVDGGGGEGGGGTRNTEIGFERFSDRPL